MVRHVVGRHSGLLLERSLQTQRRHPPFFVIQYIIVSKDKFNGSIFEVIATYVYSTSACK